MRTAAAAVSALVVALAAAGCSADEAEPTTLPPVASPTAHRNAVGIPSASPTANSSASPSMPTEAQADTPAGASAFVQYYFSEVVNAGYATLDATNVRRLSAAECGSCANVVADIERLKSASTRVEGRRFIVAYAEAAPPESDGSVIVDFRFSSDPYVERSAAGAVVRDEPAQSEQDAQAKVRREGSSWVMTAIRTV